MSYLFISYNHNDKEIVDSIANRLSDIVGKDNIFYDQWSIRPGDGIIDKMDEGLRKCDIFFFFVSKNSLSSEMVKLEWKNALMKRAKEKIKFVPVRLDNCDMPYILLQILYIDFNSVGFENGIKQMTDVIFETDTSHNTEYDNFQCKIVKEADNKYRISISVKNFFEPVAHFLVLVDQKVELIEIKHLSDKVRISGKSNNYELSNQHYHGFYMESLNGLALGFPYEIQLSSNKLEQFNVLAVLREYKKGAFRVIPLKTESSIKQ